MIYGNLSVTLKKVLTRKFVFFVFVFWGLRFRHHLHIPAIYNHI